MGGRAFSNLELKPITREQIAPTVSFIVETLAIDGFSNYYATSNMMGSAGKQDISSDLDFAINNKICRFIGEEDLPLFNLSAFALKSRKILGEKFVYSKGLSGGQVNTAWPICGDSENGLVQVDFIAGNPKWLKFTHWNPGRDISPWKGVLISTMLGTLVKRHVDYYQECAGQTVAKVGLYYDLECGLHRKWFVFDQKRMSLRSVAPDVFETLVSEAPRFPRVDYIDDPETVLRMIFGYNISLQDVSTFELLVKTVYKIFPDEFLTIKNRFIEAFMRSGGKRYYTIEDIENSNVWNP